MFELSARRTLALVAVLAGAFLGAAPAAEAAFEWRGIVEGPYGPPWDHEQRARTIEWMPRHGFNAYVHAPKDDLYQRTQWRDPYPPDQQREFEAEIRVPEPSTSSGSPTFRPPRR